MLAVVFAMPACGSSASILPEYPDRSFIRNLSTNKVMVSAQQAQTDYNNAKIVQQTYIGSVDQLWAVFNSLIRFDTLLKPIHLPMPDIWETRLLRKIMIRSCIMRRYCIFFLMAARSIYRIRFIFEIWVLSVPTIISVADI